jgi:hypothetical protein
MAVVRARRRLARAVPRETQSALRVQLGQSPGARRLQNRDALPLALVAEHEQRGRRERRAEQVPERVQVALARDDADADLGDVPGRDLPQEGNDEGGPTHNGKVLQAATLGQGQGGEKVLCAAWLDRVRTTELEVCRLTFRTLALVVKEGDVVFIVRE